MIAVQSSIYAGYGAAAAVLGAPCQLYRPNGPANPLFTQVGTVQAAFDTRPTFDFKNPSTYAKPIWYGLFDASPVQVGDYIESPSSLFFVASLEPLHPPMLVECNREVSVLRPHTETSGSGFGAQPYGGDERPHEDALMTGWPASILQGTKGEKSDSALPDDTRLPWYAVLMPSLPGVVIGTDDVLTDDLGRRYKVSSAELSSLGWRLSVMLAET